MTVAVPVRTMGKTRDLQEETILNNLKRFREEVELSQAQAADLSGVPLDNLRRYEKGDSGVPATVLKQLADVYGHKVDDFYRDDPPKADRAEVPAYFLRTFPGMELDPDLHRKVLRFISEVNAEARSRKPKRK